MLLVVQFVQISRNLTTYENMKRYSLPPTQMSGVVTAALVSGSTTLGPDGAGLTGSHSSSTKPPHKPGGFFATWKKLLGLDAFMVTASSSSHTNNRNRRRENPFSRGVFTNCRDFWCDPAPYFGKRTVGDAMLGGEVVNYARVYDVPLRTTGRGGRGRGMRYEEVGGDGEDVEGVEGV